MDKGVLICSEVIVCGGGPAGVCAAISAARQGKRTLIIERSGALGGVWTNGLLSWFLDMKNKEGIIQEICEQISAEGKGYYGRSGNFITEPEYLKYILEKKCMEAGVEVLLYAQLCGAEVEDRKIKSVDVMGKSGVFQVKGQVYIDCTGDGDLGYYAGCTYYYGEEKSAKTQPTSLLCLVDGIEYEKAKEYSCTFVSNAEKIKEVMAKAGISASYQRPSLWHIQNNLWLMMTNQQYAVSSFDVRDLTRATLEARREVNEQVIALRKYGEPFTNMRIVATGNCIGVRESRRILGKYFITDEDLMSGATFEDGVCTVCFGVDVHPTRPDSSFGEENGHFKSKDYEIPLRAMIAKELDNMLMAGRCISGSFYAHSSYRVTGDATVMGEAAGKYAASLIQQE